MIRPGEDTRQPSVNRVAAEGGGPTQWAGKRRILLELDRRPFRPAWWLPGPHLQTTYSLFFRGLKAPSRTHEIWDTPDDDFLNVHLTEGEPDRPIAVLLHGLEGSARSNYIVGLTHAFGRIGWSVAAMEHRSCGGVINRTRSMYHSGWTRDLEFVVGELARRRPGSRIYIAGFSLGGNVTAKWLGELGERAPQCVAAAAVICPPFDLTIAGPYVDRRMGGLYTRWFMRKLIPKAIEKERQFPGTLDLAKIRASRTFEDFDTHATAVLHGFEDAWDYWRRVSCGQFLEGIRRPTLLIASADDPFNPPETLPHKIAERQPYLCAQFTEKGGHCGFVMGAAPGATRHWAEEQVVRFFEMCEDGE